MPLEHHPDARRDEALDRFWDRIAQGRTSAAGDLDPTAAATIRRLHAIDNLPGPESAFTKRLREELMHAHMHARAGESSGGLSLPLAPGDVIRPGTGKIDQPPFVAQLATASLLILTLIASLVAFGPLRPGGVDRSMRLPVASTPAASPAAAEPVLETLFQTTIPTEDVPTGPTLDFEIWHATIAPSSRVAIPAESIACCRGPQIVNVLAGELTLRVEGPLHLVRARSGGEPGPAEEISAGTEVVLRPGDSAVYGFDIPAEYANLGSTPVHLLGGGLFSLPISTAPTGYTVNDFGSLFPAPRLPAGPISLELGRVNLPSDGTLSGPPPGALRVAATGPIPVSLGEGQGGAVTNIGRESAVVYVLTLTPASAAGGTPAPGA